jgi:ABC-type dipeptide/oligopeptide/nickel transport system ATPase subunit
MESDYKIDIKELARVNELPYKLPLKLRELLDGFKWAINHKNQSAVFVVDGRSGMGKTTISFQMAKYMSADFDFKDVCFTPEQFLKELEHTTKGQRRTLVFDEAMMLSSRAALSKINRMIVIAMSMIRSKNVFIIFNVNSIFDLDRNLALSRADVLLHCYGESLTDRGKFLAFFKGADGWDRIKELYLNGKKFYSYGNPRSNFNSTFPSHFVLDDNEYEKRKQEGVNQFLSSSQSKMGNKDKQARDIAIKELYKTGNYTQEQVAEMVGLSPKAVFNILHEEEQ